MNVPVNILLSNILWFCVRKEALSCHDFKESKDPGAGDSDQVIFIHATQDKGGYKRYK